MSYIVITMHESEINDTIYTHAYGPFDKNAAVRIASRLRVNGTVALARKLLDKTEVTAKPKTPRG